MATLQGKIYRRGGNRIETGSPETFAGVWIEHKPVFRAVVRSWDAKHNGRSTQDPLFVPQTARSYEVLVAAQKKISLKDSQMTESTSSRISISKSRNYIVGARSCHGDEEICRGIPEPHLHSRIQNRMALSCRQPCRAAGTGLRLNNRLIPECTAGFNVRHQQGSWHHDGRALRGRSDLCVYEN